MYITFKLAAYENKTLYIKIHTLHFFHNTYTMWFDLVIKFTFSFTVTLIYFYDSLMH